MNFWQAFKMKREWANELKKDDFSRQEIQDTQRILKEERKYLLSRLPDERSFLQDHFSYGYLYEKDDANDGLLQQQRDIIQKQIYQYKRLLLENDTDYHVKETSLFQEHCDEYRKEYVFCYLYFLNPRLLPLLEAHAFDLFADDLVLNVPKQQFELPKELVIKLNIIPQETQKKLLSLLTTGKINVEQYSSKEMVFYDFALLQQYEQFVEQKTFSERRIIQEFYTSVLRSLQEDGCDEKQAEFLSLFQNIPCACLESLRRNHIQNGDFVELYHLFEEELLETPAILQTYFSDKENTMEQRFQFLLEEPFMTASLENQKRILEILQKRDDAEVFALQTKIISNPKFLKTLEQTSASSQEMSFIYQNYIADCDSTILKERIALYTPPFFEQSMERQCEQMKYIMAGATAHFTKARRELITLPQLYALDGHDEILNHMNHIYDENRASCLVNQVAYAILPCEDYTLRNYAVHHLVGETKQAELEDITIEILDFPYTKQNLDDQPKAFEASDGAKIYLKRNIKLSKEQ